jgi:hypothetical protein
MAKEQSVCERAPSAKHALLRALGSDVEEDRIEEQGDELHLVEVAALEGLEALA